MVINYDKYPMLRLFDKNYDFHQKLGGNIKNTLPRLNDNDVDMVRKTFSHKDK